MGSIVSKLFLDFASYHLDCCIQLSAIHRHLDEMDERLDVMQSEGFLPHGVSGADDDTNNNTSALLRDYDDMVTMTKLWNKILFMAPTIKMIVILNLLWSEFVETNERRFYLLLHILITQPMCDQDL